jgi:hypothetical protein
MQSVDESAKAVQMQIAEDNSRILELEAKFAAVCKDSQLLQNQLHELNASFAAAESRGEEYKAQAASSIDEVATLKARLSQQTAEVRLCNSSNLYSEARRQGWFLWCR